MMNGLRAAFDGKLARDLVATYASLVVLAVSGLAVNVAIGIAYGAETLGAFNVAYAIFMIACQAASFGVDAAATKMVAEQPPDQARTGEILLSSLGLALTIGLPSAAIFYVFAEVGARFGDGTTLPSLLRVIAFAVPLLALNRVFVGVANGERRMGLVSAIQSSRYLLLVLGAVAVVSTEASPNHLGWIFVFAEVPPFLYLALGPYRHVFRNPSRERLSQTKSLWRFGKASFIGATVVELNFRVDVVMMALLADAREVGIYSLAAVAAEGIAQFVTVIALSLNPLIARMSFMGDIRGLKTMMQVTARTVYLAAAITVPLMFAAYPLFMKIFVDRPEFAESWPMFGALSIGIFAVSGYLPFRQLVLFAGRPWWYSIQIGGMAVANVTACALLIPYLGGIGAGLASSSAHIAGLALMALIVSKVMRLPLPLPWRPI